MGIEITVHGDWSKTENYLRKMSNTDIFASLEHFGSQGVAALQAATPVESGLTASSWSYEIKQSGGYYSIRWVNTNSVNGVPVAILLQYGHGTRQGGYVHGRDYIMPAIRPVFDQISAEMDKVVRG
jgi:hypothetical protein